MNTQQRFQVVIARAGALLGLALGVHPVTAQNGDGLRWPTEAAAGSGVLGTATGGHWKGRIGLDWTGTAATSPGVPRGPWSDGDTGSAGLQLTSVRLLGDYYFSGSSGFRATGGLLRGAWSAPWRLSGPAGSTPSGLIGVTSSQAGGLRPPPGSGLSLPPSDAATPSVPYLGAGYSLDIAQPSGSAWSFSADVGLIALDAGNAVRLGRVFTGGQNLDDLLRDMRLRPMIQLGVSYTY